MAGKSHSHACIVILSTHVLKSNIQHLIQAVVEDDDSNNDIVFVTFNAADNTVIFPD